MHKSLFAPYNYTVYITNAFCLSGYSNAHPEAPKLYLDAFLIDSSLEGYQRVYLLLGSNSNNTITVRAYEKFPDGRIMSVETQAPLDWHDAEHDLFSFVDVIISSFCEITSICKLKKVTSKFNLEEAIL